MQRDKFSKRENNTLLGFKMSDDICDCEKATALLSEKADYNEFKKSCRLRSIDEILDMTDLYFRYHWACVEKRLKPETQTGNLIIQMLL